MAKSIFVDYDVCICNGWLLLLLQLCWSSVEFGALDHKKKKKKRVVWTHVCSGYRKDHCHFEKWSGIF